MFVRRDLSRFGEATEAYSVLTGVACVTTVCMYIFLLRKRPSFIFEKMTKFTNEGLNF